MRALAAQRAKGFVFSFNGNRAFGKHDDGCLAGTRYALAVYAVAVQAEADLSLIKLILNVTAETMSFLHEDSYFTDGLRSVKTDESLS
jgi:hypothetical protein